MPVIKEAYCTENSRYKANIALAPVGVVLHSVGTSQPSAEVFVKIWSENRSQYFTHYVLDDETIFHTMPDDRRCWHVGSPGNSKWLGIEMCEPDTIKYTGGASFDVLNQEKAAAFAEGCYRNAVWLIAKLCRSYGWDPETTILTHSEITAKKLSKTTHVDPEHLWKGLGLPYSLKTLKEDVRLAMNGAEAPEETQNTPAAPSGSSAKPELDPARAFDRSMAGSWRVTASGLNVRTGAGTDHEILTVLPEGAVVRNYGYYTRAKNGTNWLYVAFLVDGRPMEGFCSGRYLARA